MNAKKPGFKNRNKPVCPGKKNPSSITDMTSGNPTRLLLVFSVPMLIGNIFQQIYNLVDSMVVGRYVGSNALGAVGATGSITFFFFALCSGISSGAGIITSQFFGAKYDDKVKNSMANAAYLSLAMAILVGALAFFLSLPMLNILKTPASIMRDAMVYLRIMCVGVPLVAIYNYAASMLRALGDSRGPLYFLIAACVINVVLDLFFVKGLGMGVLGVALATIIAQVISGVGCLIYAYKSNPYFRMDRVDLRLNRGMIKKSISLGLPLSLQFSLIAISGMGMQFVVNSFGASTVAAFTATSRIEQLLHQPYGSLSTALATYTGQNFGAKRHDRIKQGFIKSVIIMSIFSLVMLPVMQIFGDDLVSLFVRDADIISMGGRGLGILSYFFLALGMINVCRGVLNGIGDGIFALQNGIVEVVFRILVPVVLTRTALGVWGIWVAGGLVWFFSALFCVIRYIKKRRMVLL